ncbi:MAG: hypothetical protein F4Y22_05295 [Gammaproteobacteria bacterium]|nr:hypothetical protein [Gammaproteobacteria bacterium]MYH46839.1 hypothetical protein [Gammaproteobacteria bacterium]MYL13561.1 hypothetical protein [Gammaproteobacteria bacterium]
MDGLLDKISSYNIFNYLLPGSIFAVVADALTSFRVLQEDIVVGLFLYYFIGLVVSRIGSLVIEPSLKAVRFITFVDYGKFIEASRGDPAIEVLSETNNMYRTLCALFVVLPSVVLFDRFASALPWLMDGSPFIVGAILLVLFSYAYRKQTAYITKRVNKAVEDAKTGSTGNDAG